MDNVVTINADGTASVKCYGNGEYHSVTVDIADLHILGRLPGTWSVAAKGRTTYAVMNFNGHTLYMHRFLCGFPTRPNVIDHVDGNGLNNTRENMQVVTPAANLRKQRLYDEPAITNQSSGLRGIYPATGGWRVKVCGVTLGVFADLEDAKTARKEAVDMINRERTGR